MITDFTVEELQLASIYKGTSRLDTIKNITIKCYDQVGAVKELAGRTVDKLAKLSDMEWQNATFTPLPVER